MHPKLLRITSLVVIILLLALTNPGLLSSGRARAEVDRETVYKGLLFTGVLVAVIKVLSGDASECGTQSGEPMEYSQEDLYWLAKAIHAEARGEPYKGQIAVGAVILNRVKSDKFPDKVYDVIFQEQQFTSVEDAQIFLEPNETAYEAAREAFEGRDPSRGAIYFYNPETARNMDWFATREQIVKIGNHVFAR